MPHDVAVAAHPGVVVEIPRLGHARDRQDQQAGPRLPHGLDGHFELGAVDRVLRDEPHHALPAQLAHRRGDLRGRLPDFPEIKVQRQAQHFEFAADVEAPVRFEIVRAGMEGSVVP